MSLKDAQKKVDEWISQHKEGYWKPHELISRLTEEVGELAREVNHMHGPKRKKSSEETKEMADEMGDIIFGLCCLANSHDIDLDEAFERAINKCYGRDKDRFEKK